jgi:hypothetical protein
VIQGQTISYQVNIVSYLKPGVNAALFSSTYILYDFGLGFDTLTTYSILVDPSVVGVEEIQNSVTDALIFPNPANDHVTVLLADMPTNGMSVTLTDAAGRVVHTITGGALSNRIELDVAALQRGMYIVRIAESDGRVRSLPLLLN